MISFDFDYYKPDTIDEAVNLYDKLNSEGKKPIYYGGGTEFISMARMNNVYADAIIDVKGIAECNVYEFQNDELIIGSAVTLSGIAEKELFPLLSLAVERIADHTIQDKITLGGNIAGTIIYRETVLPLLVANGEITLASNKGRRRVPLSEVFDKKIQLNKGEMIVQVIVNKKYTEFPYLHVKRTKNEKIDYPLISSVALVYKKKINIAFSGLCEYPFRSADIENIINNKKLDNNEKINKIIENIPDKILNDISGTSNFRIFMLGKILGEVLEEFKEDLHA